MPVTIKQSDDKAINDHEWRKLIGTLLESEIIRNALRKRRI
jgi:DnaJ-domain-containing protein 1